MIAFVIDTESVGLHGPTFAVGWTVQKDGAEIAHGAVATSPFSATGVSDADLLWVANNVVPAIKDVERVVDSYVMFDRFWAVWTEWRIRGALMWADVSWPVEARFLSNAVSANRERRATAPYPLHDIATVVHLVGVDPTADRVRLEGELPAHNPLADARQSARMLWEALARLRGDKT